MLDVLGIKNAQKLVPLEDDERPIDPVSENMNALKGKPMKAFITQDQDAHIAVHQAFLQDPNIMQTIGQNPQASKIMASLQAHIAEHLGFHYRNEIEKQMGVTLPEPGKHLPAEVENELSKLIAQASKQLLDENKAEAAQQKNQQLAQDPLVQMQQKELAIKEKDVGIKEQKVMAEAQAKQAQIANESTRIANQKEVDLLRIQADTQKHGSSQSQAAGLERLRLGVDAAKTNAQLAVQREAQRKVNQ
jgi:hypothetical protein